MKANPVTTLAVLWALLGLHTVAQAQGPLGTAFTYQGQLEEGGVPADGSDYDFRFRLFDDPNAGAQVGTAQFRNPAACIEVMEGIEGYLERHEVSSVRELIGSLVVDSEWV